MRHPLLTRTLPLLAAGLAGGTLLLLLLQPVVGGRVEMEVRTPPDELAKELLEADRWEIDPTVRRREIMELREVRGTVLAGTMLARESTEQEFGVALAQFTGELPDTVIPVRKAEIMSLLRRTAADLDAHAAYYEERKAYPLADELRRCASSTRETARVVESGVEHGPQTFNFFSTTR